MSIKLQRFDFGNLRDFRGPLVVAPQADEVQEEAIYVPPPPTFSEAELDMARMEAKQQAYAEGFEAGQRRAAEQLEAKRIATDNVIINLGKQVQGLQQSYQQLLDKEATELSQLVHLIARKVAGESLAANCSETISALVARCLPVILSKPRLNIELHPESFEHAIGQIETLLQTSGFEGEIQFRTNPNLGTYDVVLDWGVGGANRNTATLWQEIETLLASMPVTLAPLPIEADIMEPEATGTGTFAVDQNGSDLTDIVLPPTA